MKLTVKKPKLGAPIYLSNGEFDGYEDLGYEEVEIELDISQDTYDALYDEYMDSFPDATVDEFEFDVLYPRAKKKVIRY